MSWVECRRGIGCQLPRPFEEGLLLPTMVGFHPYEFDRIQNWTYAKGIYLKVRHSDPSAHTFRVILKDTTCEQVRLSNFKNVFCNPNLDQKVGDANPIFIPFDSFDQMEQMGRRLSPGQVFNRAEVTELGLMAIKPSVVGEFELHIEEWGLYL